MIKIDSTAKIQMESTAKIEIEFTAKIEIEATAKIQIESTAKIQIEFTAKIQIEFMVVTQGNLQQHFRWNPPCHYSDVIHGHDSNRIPSNVSDRIHRFRWNL